MNNGPLTYHGENKDNITNHKLEMQPSDIVNAVSVSMVMGDCTGPFATSNGSCIYGKLKLFSVFQRLFPLVISHEQGGVHVTPPLWLLNRARRLVRSCVFPGCIFSANLLRKHDFEL